ncbi:hypothetical protein D3C80_1546210 [compost metagenome]
MDEGHGFCEPGLGLRIETSAVGHRDHHCAAVPDTAQGCRHTRGNPVRGRLLVQLAGVPEKVSLMPDQWQ